MLHLNVRVGSVFPAKPYDLFTGAGHDWGAPEAAEKPPMDVARIPLFQPPAVGREGQSEADLRKVASSFEAAFLAEMLQHTGLNAMPATFGGGAGEEAFSSMLTEQYAGLLSDRGGIGLAERIFEVLKQGTSNR